MPDSPLQELIDEQIGTSRGMNLFSEDALESFRFTDAILESMDEFTEANDEEWANLVAHAKNATMAEFCRVNQYYAVDAAFQRNLETVYLLLLDDIRTWKRRRTDDSTADLARRHFLRLRHVLKQTNPFAETLYSADSRFLAPVPCFEYSPSLQIDILGIDLDDLARPVLDIGCGKEARLVAFLRSQGIDTFGMDRFVEPSPYLIRASWFEFVFQPGRWGTIVSHLGFSNHFRHHHHRNDGDYVRYAQTYLKILSSLKIGGRFHYTPGLEFMERYLDCRKYAIERKSLDNGFDSVIIERIKNQVH